MITPYKKELEEWKILPWTKGATADKNITEIAQEAVSNVEITVNKQKQSVKSEVPRINYPYFAKIFNFVVVKLKLLRKSCDFLLLGGFG